MSVAGMRIIAAVVLLALFFVCKREVRVQSPEVDTVQVPIVFSHLPFPTLKKFRKKIILRFRREQNLNGAERTVYDYLVEQVRQTPGATGIKNLKIRVYSSSYQAAQFLNVIGWLAELLNVFGLSWKTVLVEGEVY